MRVKLDRGEIEDRKAKRQWDWKMLQCLESYVSIQGNQESMTRVMESWGNVL